MVTLIIQIAKYKVYYSDNYTHDVTIENIQNYQSDYLKTITL